jgi:hypothetical protein
MFSWLFNGLQQPFHFGQADTLVIMQKVSQPKSRPVEPLADVTAMQAVCPHALTDVLGDVGQDYGAAVFGVRKVTFGAS